MASNTPLTVCTALGEYNNFGAWIGSSPDKRYYPPNSQKVPGNSYWFLVLDRFDLNNVLVDLITDSFKDVPAEVVKYNDSRYMLIVATKVLVTYHVPQGPLRDFLAKHGAGDNLNRLEQLNLQIGCGSLGKFGFAMVCVLGDSDVGFSTASIGSMERCYLTLSLQPTQVDGKTMYTPIADTVHVYTPIS